MMITPDPENLTEAGELISKEEFDQLELKLDEVYESTPVFGSGAPEAHWKFCQFVEAYNIVAVLHLLDRDLDTADQGRLIAELDGMKTAMDFALALLSRQLSKEHLPNVAHDEFDFEIAFQLYKRSIENAQEYWLFPPARALKTTFWRRPGSDVLETRWADRDQQYWALQRILPLQSKGFSPLWDMIAALSGPDGVTFEDTPIDWGTISLKISKQVSVRETGIRADYDFAIASELYRYFNSQAIISAPGWVFPWGAIEKVGRYHSALFTLSIYHLIAIYIGGPKAGGGHLCERHASLLMNPSDLNAKITQLTGLESVETATITQALTYGNGTTSPDPALQPLIGVSESQLAIPGTIILSNAWCRNQMSLHARLDADDFGCRSHAFETDMTAALMADSNAHFRPLANIHLAGEEVDLVLIDDANKAIILGELRWVLTPGGSKEILTKQKEVLAKTTQAQRKLDKILNQSKSALSRLNCTGGGWQFHAIVAVEGFAGLPSDRPKSIPIVPASVLAAATHGFTDLRKLHAFFCSPLWLPRKNIDYVAITNVCSVLGQSFRTQAVLPGNAHYLGGSFEGYVKQANELPLAALKTLPW